jgi:hypothetical protein
VDKIRMSDTEGNIIASILNTKMGIKIKMLPEISKYLECDFTVFSILYHIEEIPSSKIKELGIEKEIKSVKDKLNKLS